MKLRKKILLIQPEPRVRHLVHQALGPASSYSIREEHDGASALHSVRWFRPDLIMVDCNGRAPDAEMTARKWRSQEECQQTPLVCISDTVPEYGFFSAGVVSGYSFLAGPFGFD